MWVTLKEFYFLVLHELKFKKKNLNDDREGIIWG